MPNRQYEAGDRFEKRVKTDLEKRGYICWQTRGSKSAVDIVALVNYDGPHLRVRVVLVQVKAGQKQPTHSEWNKLLDVARSTHGAAVIADRDGRGIRYRTVIDYHKSGSRDWPAEAYEP